MANAFPLVLARLDGDELAFFGIVVFGVVAWVLIYNLRKAYETRQRERTRRDVAAYVAEGTIRPQDAALLLNTENQTDAIIADAVAWGTINPEKAESLIRSMKQNQPAAAAPAQA